MIDFKEFSKIPRWSRDIIITEKIDGTNASVFIGEDGTFLTGSRTRWITPEDDNYGFAKWAQTNKEELLKLGPGHHFGEWWGNGINRGYGVKEKRFSLFNVSRWTDDAVRPECCEVVPMVFGPLPNCDRNVEMALSYLSAVGSFAAPGWLSPEGIVIFHVAANQLFKKTLFKDEEHKGKSK